MACVYDFQVIRQHVIGARAAGAFALAFALYDRCKDFEGVEPWKLALVLPHLLILTLGICEAPGFAGRARLWRLDSPAKLDDLGSQKQDETPQMIFEAKHVVERRFDETPLHVRAQAHLFAVGLDRLMLGKMGVVGLRLLHQPGRVFLVPVGGADEPLNIAAQTLSQINRLR